MAGHRVIVAKPWNPSPITTSIESCSSESSDNESSSFFTTTGTPTIDTALREGSMPEVVLSTHSWSSNVLDSSTETSVGRQSAGREAEPQDGDSVVVSISDRRTASEGSDRLNSSTTCANEELCCLHGRPCGLARTTSDTQQVREQIVKVPGYEPVKIDRLENPPESFTRRRNDRSRAPETLPSQPPPPQPAAPKSNQMIYRCRMPSDMSSLASPVLSSNMTTPTPTQSDGIYENIDCFNYATKPNLTTSQSSLQTARDTTVITHPNPRRRQPSPTLSDFYLGAMRKRDAEKRVKRRTYFRLYHRVPSNAYADLSNLRDHVALYIVYKTSKGGYCHYPIQRVRGETPAGYKSTKYFYVDCMEDLPPRFNSLDALVRFYSVYVQLDLVEKAGDVEVFPVPKRNDEREKRHRQKERRY